MNNIKFIKGNIFTSTMQTKVNTVNCVGVMGAGIALEFKYRFPEMFDRYKAYCDSGHIQIGKLWIYDIPNSEQKVLNFPTKYDWKYPSKYEYLQKGLERFIEKYKEKNIKSIAFPMLGAQNGKLDIEKVKELMYSYLSKIDIPVQIYEYTPYAKDDLIDKFIDVFENNSIAEIVRITGLKKNPVTKLKTAIADNELNSLLQLTKIKGIGKETVKSCFKFATKRQIPINKDMFIEAEKKQTIKNIKEKPISELSLQEKAKITGLNTTEIVQIENKNIDISIGQIIKYCKSIGLDFTQFVSQNYANIS